MAAPSAGHILIVDDDAELMEVLKYLLEDEGFEVSTADSQEIALSIAAGGKIDLVLLEIGTAGLDGREVAMRVRSAGTRLAVHTAGEEAALLEQGVEHDAFITKGEDPEPVLDAICALLDRPRATVSSAERRIGADAASAAPSAVQPVALRAQSR
jgi:two-component system response regulator VicR